MKNSHQHLNFHAALIQVTNLRHDRDSFGPMRTSLGSLWGWHWMGGMLAVGLTTMKLENRGLVPKPLIVTDDG